MRQSQPQESDLCPECGAPAVGGMTCQDQLAAILGWEIQDPELFSLHFHTVASFNLQHPAQFTDEALLELRSSFIEALDGTTPIADLSRRMGAKFEGGGRVLRSEQERRPILKQWEVTASDVFAGGRPEGAVYRVRRWASSVRMQM